MTLRLSTVKVGRDFLRETNELVCSLKEGLENEPYDLKTAFD